MNATPIEQLVAAQRQFFASGRTLDLAFRKRMAALTFAATSRYDAMISSYLSA